MGPIYRNSHIGLCSNVISHLLIIIAACMMIIAYSFQESSIASEEGISFEFCNTLSTSIIATDGGLVDIASVDRSEISRVFIDNGTVEDVVSDLESVCGYSSVIIFDPNISQKAHLTEPINVLPNSILGACSSNIVMVEVIQDHKCTDFIVPMCGENRINPWTDIRVNPWTDLRVNPWTDIRINPWTDLRNMCADDRGFVWSDVRINPWTDVRINPWTDLRINPWTDSRGFVWSD